MSLYNFLDAACRSSDIDDYSPRELIHAAERLGENDQLTEDEQILLKIIQDIVSLTENYNERNNVFSPFAVLEGCRSFSPKDMTQEKWAALQMIDLDKLPTVIKARIADFIWDQRKDYMAGIIAIQAYIQLHHILWDEVNWNACFDMIQRAISIAAQINKNSDEYKNCLDTIKSSIKKTKGKDTLYLSLELLKLLNQHERISESDLIICAIEIVETAKQNNIVKLDEGAHLLYVIYKAKGEESEGRKYLCLLAEEYVSMAHNKADMLLRRIEHLKKAIHIYRTIHDRSNSEKYLKELEIMQPEMLNNMQYFQLKYDVTEYRKHVLELTDKQQTLPDFVRILACCCSIKSKNQLFQDITGNDKLVIDNFFGEKEIDDEGHQLYQLPPLDFDNIDISSPEVVARMWRKAAAEQKIFGSTCLEWIIEEMNKRIDYNIDDLNYIVTNNGIIPEGREKIIRSGLFMGLRGDYYAALHILLPQIEHLYRNIAHMCGAITYTLENDNSSQAKTLGSIFALPELIEAYDEDVLFCLRGLLDEKAGSNLRNMVAHGLLNPYTANSGIGQYFLCLFIKILLWTAVEEYNKGK